VEVNKTIVESLTLNNSLPFFDDLINEMKVNVTYDAEGFPDSLKVESFTSQPPFDRENDIVEISFEHEKLAFLTVEANEDLSFTLEVDRAFIQPNDTGRYTVFVRLTDDKSLPDELMTYEITIHINYTQILPEEKVIEPMPTEFQGIDPAVVNEFLMK